jgi:hypothetical protein
MIIVGGTEQSSKWETGSSQCGVDNKTSKLLLAANASGKSLGRSAQNLYLSFNFIFIIFVLALWFDWQSLLW